MVKKPKVTFSTFDGWNIWGPIAFLILLAFASRGEAMGTATCSVQKSDGTFAPCVFTAQIQASKNTTNDSCASPAVVIETGQKICPIYPEEAISNALDEQLKGAP